MPNMIKVAVRHPRQVQICWKSHVYALKDCGFCGKAHWHATTEKRRSVRCLYLYYCSDRCKLANWKVLNRERQRRYKAKLRAMKQRRRPSRARSPNKATRR